MGFGFLMILWAGDEAHMYRQHEEIFDAEAREDRRHAGLEETYRTMEA